MTPTIIGMLRVKNEARWIADVLASIRPLCSRTFVFDDHSDDSTVDLCAAGGAIVSRSPFTDLDEARDKNWLLDAVLLSEPWDPTVPHWALMIDGDEVLDAAGADLIRATLPATTLNAFRLPVRYLWNSDLAKFPDEKTIRVDGVYRNFTRPSLFRLTGSTQRFQTTAHGGNFHCSSIPGDLIRDAGTLDAQLWHLGYNDKADRLRKHAWYNAKDPNNQFEDRYRHCIQGDVPEVPANAGLRHAGPLTLKTFKMEATKTCSAA